MAVARGDRCAVFDGAQDKAPCQRDGLRQVVPQGQVCGNGRRQGAARAMHIATGNAARRQPLGRDAGLCQQVHHLVTGQMPAFEQHRACALGQQVLRGRFERVCVGNVVPQQQSGFVQIGRDQARTREQLAHQHLHGLAGNQPVTAGGHHHGVEHHVAELVMVDGPGHHLHDGRCVQHADLDGIDANVFHHRLDLRLQKLSRYAMDALHAHGVLCGQRRDGAHAIAAQGGKGFEVGLNARAAAAVRTGNRENACVMQGRWRGRSDAAHALNYPQLASGIFQKDTDQ